MPVIEILGNASGFKVSKVLENIQFVLYTLRLDTCIKPNILVI